MDWFIGLLEKICLVFFFKHDIFQVPPCTQVQLTIEDSLSSLVNPKQIYRSQILSLSSQTYFKCDTNYSFVYNWTITSVATGFSVDLTTNPTSSASQLVIQAYSLPYGVYSVQLRADLAANASYNTLYSTATSYVQILPLSLIHI